jgi:hypothetical protein
VYRRRRVVAVVLAVALVVVVTVGLRLALPPLARVVGGGPLTASDDPPPVPAGADTVLVQPGDTLWSIAAGLEGGGDVRATVDRLAVLNGGSDLQVGQRLVVPSG